jgi:hypothetical protein
MLAASESSVTGSRDRRRHVPQLKYMYFPDAFFGTRAYHIYLDFSLLCKIFGSCGVGVH